MTIGVVGVCLLSGCRQPVSQPAKPPATPVTAATPVEREIVEFEQFTGRTNAVESVDIRSRVTGYLDKICFQDGADVKEGEVLFQIDARPFQAALEQAQSQVTLREADMNFREAELKRAEPLLPKNAISKSDYDQIAAAYAQAKASVAAAKANEKAAALNVEYTTLRSPISGEISRTQITRGNLVLADQTILTNVVSVDPMYVYFDIDEPTLLHLQQLVREGKIKVQPNALLPAWMAIDNGQGFAHKGTIDFAENRFDPNTGTINVRGVFPNPKPPTGTRVLAPGQYARVGIPVGNPYQALLIADRAVMTDQGQKYVFIIDAENKAEYQPVTLGKLEKGLRVVKSGLKPSDRVIVVGGARVRPGNVVAAKMEDMDAFAAPDAEQGVIAGKAQTSASKPEKAAPPKAAEKSRTAQPASKPAAQPAPAAAQGAATQPKPEQPATPKP